MANYPQTILKVASNSYATISISLHICCHSTGLSAFPAASLLLIVIFKVAVVITLKAVMQMWFL